MMQVLIVTHANMAAGIVSSVDLIMGPQEGLYSIGLAADDSFESFNEKFVTSWMKSYVTTAFSFSWTCSAARRAT